MKRTDWAYLAGLFDGEGCVSLHRVQRKTINQRLTYYLQINISSTNEWICQYLKYSFGGRLYKEIKRGNSKPAFRWWLNSKKAELFLHGILPYLHIKKLHAELAIKFNAHKKRGGHHPQEYIDFERDYKQLITTMNHRGRYK